MQPVDESELFSNWRDLESSSSTHHLSPHFATPVRQCCSDERPCFLDET